MRNNIAVCTMCFNRPEYLGPMVESFENCVEKDTVDWWFFQDGSVNRFSGIRRAQEPSIQASTQICKEADLPNNNVVVNDWNLNQAHQRDKIYSLFDEGYDSIIVFEGDQVVTPYMIPLFRTLIEQFPDCVTSLYGVGLPDDANPRDHLDEVVIGGTGLWFSTAITEESWRKIEDRWNDFMDIVGEVDLHPETRPVEPIWDEFQTPDLPISAAVDGVLGQLARDFDIPRCKVRKDRHSNIGEHGQNLTPETYHENEYGEEYPIEFEEDRDGHDWRVVSTNEPFEDYEKQ